MCDRLKYAVLKIASECEFNVNSFWKGTLSKMSIIKREADRRYYANTTQAITFIL